MQEAGQELQGKIYFLAAEATMKDIFLLMQEAGQELQGAILHHLQRPGHGQHQLLPRDLSQRRGSSSRAVGSVKKEPAVLRFSVSSSAALTHQCRIGLVVPMLYL